MLSLVGNDPDNLSQIASMLSNKDDMHLVWPEARYSFDTDQWRERPTAHPDNRSFLVAQETPHATNIVGHAALMGTEVPHTFAVSYLYLDTELRGKGLGRQLMGILEAQARGIQDIKALRLRVRTYNPRAIHVYETAGFSKTSQDGILISICKELT